MGWVGVHVPRTDRAGRPLSHADRVRRAFEEVVFGPEQLVAWYLDASTGAVFAACMSGGGIVRPVWAEHECGDHDRAGAPLDAVGLGVRDVVSLRVMPLDDAPEEWWPAQVAARVTVWA